MWRLNPSPMLDRATIEANPAAWMASLGPSSGIPNSSNLSILDQSLDFGRGSSRRSGARSIVPFASRTGGANLENLRRAGWGLLISATGEHRDEGFETICIDNGAWTNR